MQKRGGWPPSWSTYACRILNFIDGPPGREARRERASRQRDSKTFFSEVRSAENECENGILKMENEYDTKRNILKFSLKRFLRKSMPSKREGASYH